MTRVILLNRFFNRIKTPSHWFSINSSQKVKLNNKVIFGCTKYTHCLFVRGVICVHVFMERLISKHHNTFRQPCHRPGNVDGHFPHPDPFTDNPEPQNDREERKGSGGKEKQRLFCMVLRWARWEVCLFI